MNRTFLAFCVIAYIFLNCRDLHGHEEPEKASWVWSRNSIVEPRGQETIVVGRWVDLHGEIKHASVAITADNEYELYINGTRVGGDGEWPSIERFEVQSLLKHGRNAFIAVCTNTDAGPGAAGLAIEIEIDGRRMVTDDSWTFSTRWPAVVGTLDPDDRSWKPVVTMGRLGETNPWGQPAVAEQLTIISPPPPPEDITKPFDLKDGDTVMFIGSEFTEQRIKHNHLEALLSGRWPDRRIRFRNLGWSGDTPSGISRGYFGGAAEGYRRLIEEIGRIQPTVVFLEYGSVAAYDGQEGVEPFLAELDRLINDLRRHTNRIVLTTPPAADGHDLNAKRQFIADALNKYAKHTSVRFVDLLTPTRAAITKQELLNDPIRYNSKGYHAAALAVVNSLGISPPTMEPKEYEDLRNLIAAKNDLYFHRYRPQNETYLRGFRKHEQGQNAKEIATFDPLIAQAELRIAAYLQGNPLPPAPKAWEPAPRTVEALDPEDERKEFVVPKGFDISLFAAEPMIKNPIHMNFDSRGRLWVATSPIYPHIMPGAIPTDQVVILEDTNNDGRADRRTIFAEDLLIPTAVLPDDRGGAFVANSTELLHLSDTDGDGQSDMRRVILSGFGTEDTHHILHTFRWGPDGAFYFNQSVYIHTHLETPHGVERLMGSGIWRFQTDTWKADAVMRGLVNPWGHAFNRWGQSFATDGAGGDGINYAFRGSAFPTAVGYSRTLRGLNPGQPKYCSLVVISGRGFPEDWQDSMVANDFRGNRVKRFMLAPQGSGYISRQQPDVITSNHHAFRPVDLKLGPDGALYIADWYNPIINHGEVDFRDPRRDTEHGRIWRLEKTDAPSLDRPDVSGASIDKLVGLLNSQEQYTRDSARRQLALRDSTQVAHALRSALLSLNRTGPTYEHDRLEILWAFQTIGVIDTPVLEQVISSPDYRTRAAAMRVLDDWGPQIVNGIELLNRGIEDVHPQVRLEAVNTARYFKTAEAAAVAMKAIDREMDVNLDFALWETMRRLEDFWLPSFMAGEMHFGGDPAKAAFAINAIEKPAALEPVVNLLRSGKLDGDAARDTMPLIGRLGQPQDLDLLFEMALSNAAHRDEALSALNDAAGRGIRPTGDLSRITELLDRPTAAELAGRWRIESARRPLIQLAGAADTNAELRSGAFLGLASIEDRDSLIKLTDLNFSIPRRRMAIVALARFDPAAAATPAAELLSDPAAESETQTVINAFLSRSNGPQLLAETLKDTSIPMTVATRALQEVSAAGESGQPLVNILTASAAKATMQQRLSAEEMSQLVKEVSEVGNPDDGQAIFRRANLACMSCHAIAGGGGRVGPDLLSLGASAPVDYIIESLLEPSKKIKEGYHAVMVVSDEGEVAIGTIIREGGGMTVVRNAVGQEIEFANDHIDRKQNLTTSLMPEGLTAPLTRDEFINLAAFLSSLGKEGFQAPSRLFVRKWIVGELPIYSRVDGTLPAKEIKGKTIRFKIDITVPGVIGITLNNSSGITIESTSGDFVLNDARTYTADLPSGEHELTLEIDAKRTKSLSVEVTEIPGSKASATPWIE